MGQDYMVNLPNRWQISLAGKRKRDFRALFYRRGFAGMESA
jgi:hypothetical protein